MTSPLTSDSGAMVCSVPSRMTVAVGRVSRAIRSRIRLARTSCTTLTITLREMTPVETSASPTRPSSRSVKPSPKRQTLIKVKTFSRRISQYDRLARGGLGRRDCSARRVRASTSESPCWKPGRRRQRDMVFLLHHGQVPIIRHAER